MSLMWWLNRGLLISWQFRYSVGVRGRVAQVQSRCCLLQEGPIRSRLVLPVQHTINTRYSLAKVDRGSALAQLCLSCVALLGQEDQWCYYETWRQVIFSMPDAHIHVPRLRSGQSDQRTRARARRPALHGVQHRRRRPWRRRRVGRRRVEQSTSSRQPSFAVLTFIKLVTPHCIGVIHPKFL